MDWPRRRCPTCGHIEVLMPRCRCGHLWGEHNIENKRKPCSRGAGLSGYSCDCPNFEEDPDASHPDEAAAAWWRRP